MPNLLGRESIRAIPGLQFRREIMTRTFRFIPENRLRFQASGLGCAREGAGGLRPKLTAAS
jgi:hypothetical protein